MTKKLYGFQCPKCFISSGTASTNTADAPTCCGDVLMDAYEIPNADEFGPEDLSSDEEYKSSFLLRPCRVCGRDIEFDPYAPYYVCDICATYYGIDR